MDSVFNLITSGKGIDVDGFLSHVLSSLVARHGLREYLERKARVDWLRYSLKKAGYLSKNFIFFLFFFFKFIFPSFN